MIPDDYDEEAEVLRDSEEVCPDCHLVRNKHTAGCQNCPENF